MRVLLVEDESKLASFIKKGLTENAYAVDLAKNLSQALSYAADHQYDIILLDVMLPDGDGFAVARQLREDQYKGPIIMLTALNSTQDKVRGLDAGADDFITKPFAFEELLARIRAALRRSQDQSKFLGTKLSFSDLTMDLVSRKVMRQGKPIHLTAKEFALCEYLLRNQKRPVSRSELLEHVWDMDFDPGSNVVDVYVNLLRKKIDQPFAVKLIQTLVGFGYELREEPK